MGLFSTKQKTTVDVTARVSTNPTFINNINVEAVGNGIVNAGRLTARAIQDVAGAILSSGGSLSNGLLGSASTLALGGAVVAYMVAGSKK